MAKDPVSGPVSKAEEDGYYGSSEKIREADVENVAEVEEILTRSPVINLFGEKVGRLLIDAGYSTIPGVVRASDDDLLDIKGIGEFALKEIRLLAPKPEALPAYPAGSEQPTGVPQMSVRVRRAYEQRQKEEAERKAASQ